MSSFEKDGGVEQNNEPQHVESAHLAGVKDDVEVIVDKDAAGYTDFHIVIDDETNKRLRRMINRR